MPMPQQEKLLCNLYGQRAVAAATEDNTGWEPRYEAHRRWADHYVQSLFYLTLAGCWDSSPHTEALYALHHHRDSDFWYSGGHP